MKRYISSVPFLLLSSLAVPHLLCVRPISYSKICTQAATIQGTINERNDMVNTLIEASKVYRKDHPGESSRCLSQIVQHFIDEGGNFRRAAKYQDDLAQIYEQQRDSANARQAYALAAQWYEGDNAIVTANKLNVKSAEHAALDGDYLDAINRFEHVVNQCLLKDTTKFSVPKYLLQAGYCHLAHDIVGAMRALQSYRKMEKDYSLSSSGKELEFLGGLMETVEQGDSKAFEDKRKERSGTHPITSWDETMFDR